MKKIFSLITIALFTLSCGEEVKNNSVDDLNSKKIEITNQIDSLSKELKVVEKELAKLNPDTKLSLITTIPVKKDVFKHYVEVQGSVKADKNIEIRPELGGTVKAIYVKEGQKVSAGQTLIQLDEDAIKNNISEVNTQLALAKTTFERQKRLWNQKIGSEIQYLQAKTQKESLENNLESLLTQAKKMKIIAPFSGIVDEIFPKNGELTSPQAPVVRLINLDKVYIEADITESFLPVVKKDSEVLVYFPTLGNEIVSKIAQIGNYINPDNRSFKTRINISNKDQSIKPNLLADIKVLDFKSIGIIIPSTLVQQDQTGQNFVFTISSENDENIVVKKIITIGKEYDHQIFVSEGLNENDVLINEGARLVKAGDLVKIKN